MKSHMLLRQIRYQLQGFNDTLVTLNRVETKIDSMKAGLTRSSDSARSSSFNLSLLTATPPAHPVSALVNASASHPLDTPTCHDTFVPEENTLLSSVGTFSQEHLTLEPDANASSISIGDTSMRTVYLGSEKLTFDMRDLKPPPVCHYSKDIPRLFVEWETSQLLVINGRGIPLKHWPVIYQRRVCRDGGDEGVRGLVGNRTWESIKVMWGNWKV